MANRLVNNTYIIDSGQTLTGLNWGEQRKVNAIHCAFNDTSGRIVFAFTSNTSNIFLTAASNSTTPYTLPYYFGGQYVDQITPILITAGTAFIHFV